MSATAQTTTIWTIDRYHKAVEAGVFHDLSLELLDGELVLMSPEGILHASNSDEAAEYLRHLLGERARVREAKPITLATSEPQPDLAIVRPTPMVYRQHHPYVEDIFWLIEYADSSLTKDLNPKKRIYGAAGIPEYWIADLQHWELKIFRDPTPNGYATERTLSHGTISPLAFPDQSVAVQRILRS